MKRLFFLVPELQMARDIVHELENIGIRESDIHIVGKNQQALQRAHVPRANIWQTSDLVPALKRGALIGVVLSVAIYVLIKLIVPAHVEIHSLAVAIIALFGVIFGLWASSLIGIGIKHPVIVKYEKYLQRGHYLMMVDSPDEREKELTFRVTKHHPGAKIAIETMH